MLIKNTRKKTSPSLSLSRRISLLWAIVQLYKRNALQTSYFFSFFFYPNEQECFKLFEILSGALVRARMLRFKLSSFNNLHVSYH